MKQSDEPKVESFRIPRSGGTTGLMITLRAQYVDKLRARLHERESELARLERMAAEEENNASSTVLRKRVLSLRYECDDLRRRLSKVSEVSAKPVARQVGDLWSRLKRGVADLLSWFGVR